MTTAIKKVIEGYEVELDATGETTQCWVTFKKYTASLAALSNEGYLVHSDQTRMHFVPARIIGLIEAWAEAHGY